MSKRVEAATKAADGIISNSTTNNTNTYTTATTTNNSTTNTTNTTSTTSTTNTPRPIKRCDYQQTYYNMLQHHITYLVRFLLITKHKQQL